MKAIAVLAVMLIAYASLLVPFTRHLQEKPFLEKVGYVPQPFVIKTLVGDQRHSVAAGLMFRVLIYFGTLIEKNSIKAADPPDSGTMRATLTSASRLDPYNMDVYYFTQSLVWDATNAMDTTELLEYGMRYRDWDYYLPFFAGFNAAYFLHDYAKAAAHYATAARLSGSDLFSRLASRYLHESGKQNWLSAILTP